MKEEEIEVEDGGLTLLKLAIIALTGMLVIFMISVIVFLAVE